MLKTKNKLLTSRDSFDTQHCALYPVFSFKFISRIWNLNNNPFQQLIMIYRINYDDGSSSPYEPTAGSINQMSETKYSNQDVGWS